MDYRNCPKCGKMFVQIRAPICPACEKSEEELFQRVREYIKEHPKNNIEVIAKETETTTKKIISYIKDGRLELTDMHGVKLKCESCGKTIYIGRYCELCVSKMNQEVANVFGKGGNQGSRLKNSKGAKMYTSIRKGQDN